MTKGRIELIIGPMYSGKTTSLLTRIKRHEIANRKCIVFKYIKDTRYDEKLLVTHDKLCREAVPAGDLEQVSAMVSDYDCIGIDEGQFFKNLAKYCDKWANEGKIVIVAGLDATFEKKHFGEIHNLIPLAEDVVKLKAICYKCYDEASFSKRTIKSKKLEVIGSVGMYVAACRKCFDEQL